MHLNEDDLAGSTVRADIEAASVYTGDDRRDQDLRSDHFLNAAEFPRLSFESAAFTQQGPQQYTMTICIA